MVHGSTYRGVREGRAGAMTHVPGRNKNFDEIIRKIQEMPQDEFDSMMSEMLQKQDSGMDGAVHACNLTTYDASNYGKIPVQPIFHMSAAGGRESCGEILSIKIKTPDYGSMKPADQIRYQWSELKAIAKDAVIIIKDFIKAIQKH